MIMPIAKVEHCLWRYTLILFAANPVLTCCRCGTALLLICCRTAANSLLVIVATSWRPKLHRRNECSFALAPDFFRVQPHIRFFSCLSAHLSTNLSCVVSVLFRWKSLREVEGRGGRSKGDVYASANCCCRNNTDN